MHSLGVWANQVLTDIEEKVTDSLGDMKLVLYSAVSVCE